MRNIKGYSGTPRIVAVGWKFGDFQLKSTPRIGAPRMEFVSLLNIYLCLKFSIYISTMAAKCHLLPIKTRTEVMELSKAGKSEGQITIEDFFKKTSP